MSATEDAAILLTGFPTFLVKRMCAKLLAHDERVWLLVHEKDAGLARQFVQRLPLPDDRKRIEILVGNPFDMDLGLSGREIQRVVDRVTSIHHMATSCSSKVPLVVARRAVVEGTREVLAMARRIRNLQRFNHYSSAFVCGDRTGVILEDELDEGQRLGSVAERTLFEAERLVRTASNDVPLSIFRPGMVVGDSKTGEIDRLHGPYPIVQFLLDMPIDIRLPLPSLGAFPLNLVPVDYVIDAAYHIARQPAGQGQTFHLTDPNPLSTRMVFNLVADAARRKRPRTGRTVGLMRWLRQLPGLAHVKQDASTFLDPISRPVVFNCHHTLEQLANSAVRCPRFDSYVERLVGHLLRHQPGGGAIGHGAGPTGN